MTVGILIHNSSEAIVISDKRITIGDYKLDGTTKSVPIKYEYFHGVITYSETVSIVTEAIESLNDFDQGSDLDSFVNFIHSELIKSHNKHYETWLNGEKEEILRRGLAITENEEKDKFLKSEQDDILKSFDKHIKSSYANILMTLFDGSKFRKYNLTNKDFTIRPLNYDVIGSGTNKIRQYVSTSLNNLDLDQLSLVDLVFHSMNAYSHSTLIDSVGGIPCINKIHKDGVCEYDQQKSIALTNLSGAFLSHGLDIMTTKAFISEIIDNKEPGYGVIANALDLTEKSLTGLCIPFKARQGYFDRR